ncbi:CbtA family protein [Azospirillum sp. ST 5-10]|uniref:CbtA family protein n=1 Tax=unclassified Azospirillum TaxID=2630922 RepID=UPI003F49E94C
MSQFRKLFFVALCAGVLSGLLVTAAHQVGAVPIILEAETFEAAAEAAGPAAHEHAAGAPAHDHGGEAWEPADGVERTAFTGLANVLTGVAFALLLVAGYAVAGGAVTWRSGAFWGLAGFATFTLAPGLGLPPEVPGTAAAPLLDRQVWWCATALLTGGGLWLLAFARRPLWAAVAVAAIVLPHLVGAPQPAEHATVAPAALVHRFIVTATVTSLLFWLCLGVSTGALYRRWVRHPA